jgi:hypothetical protein
MKNELPPVPEMPAPGEDIAFVELMNAPEMSRTSRLDGIETTGGQERISYSKPSLVM